MPLHGRVAAGRGEATGKSTEPCARLAAARKFRENQIEMCGKTVNRLYPDRKPLLKRQLRTLP